MRLSLAAFALASMAVPVEAQERQRPPRVAPPLVHDTAPALGAYTDGVLFADVWKRPQLAPRDRSLITIAALIAGGHSAQMTGHFNRGLDNGVTREEIIAIITHLAFYSGWPNSMSAVAVANEVFAKRKLPPMKADAEDALMAFDAEADAPRAAAVNAAVAPIAPALARYTNEVLFRDLWLRKDLEPRDRSLVTVVALMVSGQVEQMPFHINRAMDNGLTQEQLTEAVTHLAFYAGWPRAMSAVPVLKSVFESRAASAAKPVAASTPASAAIEITSPGKVPPTPTPEANFTGKVHTEGRFQRDAPSRLSGGTVNFPAGARTAWHTHPLGQTLVVISGCGLVQREGGPVEVIRPGDVVWIPPHVRHWHGAAPGTAMSHVAMAEAENGKVVDWMEKVTDAQYQQPAGAPRC
ncbi:carboxymuconolactone decarboxylase [Azorhizobium oxalatiphilum]|uniref:Carboxymuconolactone decarboxylase n=1 Tax=Azorhizobium oxalatiphilum TaxID=980631 RepID=A0A917BVS7_9HYPH|nr:carboxymuconolactone decarboxylase family protein [Azorhizobium oxalatiphilum]GGF58201.1 carboxymuconolactone decarboxylase [Azorhizobium oxalatiphilum]